MHRTEARQIEERVLVLAPTRRDADLACATLERAGIVCCPCDSLAHVCAAIEEGVGAAILTEECLAPEYVQPLIVALGNEPAWSDLPLLVLTGGGADSPAAVHAMETLGNVMLLERPVRITALVSAVRTALRARQKQFQIRDHLILRRLAEEALERRFKQLQTVYTLTRTMTRTESLDVIYAAALDEIRNALQVDRAAILLFDPDGVMRFKASRGLSQTYKDAVEGHSPWKCNEPDPQSITIDDVHTDPSVASLRQVIANEGIRALAFVPLMYESRLLGKFMLYFDQPHAFESEEIQLSQNIADHTAFAIVRGSATVALRESEVRYRRLVETAAEGVWEIDAQGNTVYVNEPMAEMMGYPVQEMAGRNAFEFVHSDDMSIAIEQWRRGSGSHEQRDWRLRKADDNFIWVNSSAAPVLDSAGNTIGAFAMMTDITDRKNAERRLAAEHTIARILNESQSLEEAAPVILKALSESCDAPVGGFWTLTEDERRLQCTAVWLNPAIEGQAARGFESISKQLTFEPSVGVPGRVWKTQMPLSIPELARETSFPRLPSALKLGLRSGMAFPILAAGTFYGVVELYSFHHCVPDAPTQQMMSAIGQDIAQFIRRREAEREVVVHREQLEKLVAQRTSELEKSHQKLRLSERMAALGTLSAGLGHDMGNLLLPIRSRIDAILGTLPLIEKNGHGGEQPQSGGKPVRAVLHEHVNAIRQCTDYLQSLTNGLRLLALDPADSSAAGQETEVNKWWPNVEALLKNALPRNVELVIEGFGPGTRGQLLPPLAIAPHRLTQAVFNLVKNAGDALRGAENGRVVIAVEIHGQDDSVIRSGAGKLANASKYARVAVADNGPGMSEEVRARAAEPFFTTKTRSLSTGLGLSLVHGIISSAGGALEIQSRDGQGTCIIMLLPVAASAAEQAARRGRRNTARSERVTEGAGGWREGDGGADRADGGDVGEVGDVGGAPAALVTLNDFRHRTLVEQLLGALGYAVSVQNSLEFRDDQVLWVMQASPENLDAAERFLDEDSSRVVLVAGVVEPERCRAGMVCMGEPLRFSRIRDAIRQLDPSMKEAAVER